MIEIDRMKCCQKKIYYYGMNIYEHRTYLFLCGFYFTNDILYVHVSPEPNRGIPCFAIFDIDINRRQSNTFFVALSFSVNKRT